MSMKEKINIVGDEVKLPETIKVHELSRFISALQNVLDDAVENDLEKITAEEMIKKYGLSSSYVAMLYAELKTPEVFQIKEKKKAK